MIDLVFLELQEVLHIQLAHLEEMCDTSDHVPILTVLPLEPDQGLERQRSIKLDSKAEEAFVDQLTAGITRIDVSSLDTVEQSSQTYGYAIRQRFTLPGTRTHGGMMSAKSLCSSTEALAALRTTACFGPPPSRPSVSSSIAV